MNTVDKYNMKMNDSSGAAITALLVPDVFKPINALSIATEATLWTPTSGKKFRLMGGMLTMTAAPTPIVIKDGNSGTTILVLPFVVLNTPYAFDLGNGILSAANNNNLRALGIASSVISGYLYGREE